jgi:branched-chain amino acid transport system permease protein
MAAIPSLAARLELPANLILLAILLLLPFSGLYPVLAMEMLCFALFACAFNLLLGYTGLLSFGHAAFFGTAAYVAGHVMREWGWPPLAGVGFAVLCSALLGLAIGGLAIRRSGIYFAMITLALAQLVYFVYLQLPFTHGEDGLQEIPRGSILGFDLRSDVHLYYVVLGASVGAYALIGRILGSPFGHVLRALRDNEPRAISLGFATWQFKLMAFVLSAALAGLAGALKALVLGFASLTDAHWSTSGLVILMVLVGGLGTRFGPVVGACIVLWLENRVGEMGNQLAQWTGVSWFSGLGEAVTIVTGLIFVFCVMAFRRGVVGEVLARIRR